MRIGTSIALVIIGAILASAIEFDIPLIDLGALGSILFIVGLLGLIVTVGLEVYQSRPPRPRYERRRHETRYDESPRRREPEPAYDPVLRPQRQAPRRPPSSEDPTRVAPRRE